MDEDRLTIEFAKLTAKIRETRASEVAFLAAIHAALKQAHLHRDWALVRDTMRTIDHLANDLAGIGAEAS